MNLKATIVSTIDTCSVLWSKVSMLEQLYLGSKTYASGPCFIQGPCVIRIPGPTVPVRSEL
uniref:Uncharacterized protein n=1 Tax=Amphimedon queenslandica TaxID=400682 RepID=A0A1X7TIW0_AMPQE